MGTNTAIVVILWAAVSATPVEDSLCEKVDLIEVNHFYDEQGKLVLDQLIFYDWSPTDGRFQVRAWRLLKKPTQVPRKDSRTGEYTSLWNDGAVLRKVSASQCRETWTQYDPEFTEREFLPKDKRRDLRKIVAKRAPACDGTPPTDAVVEVQLPAPAILVAGRPDRP